MRRWLVIGALVVWGIVLGHRPSGAQVPALVVERVRAPRAPEVAVGDRTITLVRVDLRAYRLRMLTESHDGPRRPLPEWVRDFGLTGGINAGMFLPSGRSCGFLMADGEVRSDRHPPASRWNALLGFDPAGEAAPFDIGGGCGRDLSAMRGAYRSVLQSRRLMIDCAGAPTNWRTGRFSAAAIGRDTEGRAVLVHVRTPYRMQVLSEMLAEPPFGLRGLAYMEGGPEASLVARGADPVSEMGSYEDGFHPSDDNHEMWDLPNIVGFAPR
jgi:hypothetical protein